MPLLKIQTNTELPPDQQATLLKRASACVAEALCKPERYVMVAIESSMPMLFAGSHAPLAYLELKSIGLPEAASATLSKTLCGLINKELNITAERIYIEFTNAPRAMWGWNNGTF